MKTTHIAGNAFDAKDADRIRQTARIYSYARRIRRLATDAAPSLDLDVAPIVDMHGRRPSATEPHGAPLRPPAT